MITESLTPKERELMIKLQKYIQRNPMDVIAHGKLMFLYWKDNDYSNFLSKTWNAVSLGLVLSRELLFIAQRAYGDTITPFKKTFGQWKLEINVGGDGIEFNIFDRMKKSSYTAIRHWNGVFQVVTHTAGQSPEIYTLNRSSDVLSHLRAFDELHRGQYSASDHVPSKLYDQFASILSQWDAQPKNPRPPKYTNASAYQAEYEKSTKRKKYSIPRGGRWD